MPGLPGPGGGKKSRGKQTPARKGKGKSGNPAKRAEQERAAAAARSSRGAFPPGSAFGPGAGQGADDDPLAGLDPSSLPPGFEKFLGR